jgi:hypothetical protein
MFALSVHQPYAWAIVAGVKQFENRTWTTAYRGKLLIHASLTQATFGSEDDWDLEVMRGMPSLANLAFGAVVGLVCLLDCLTGSEAEEWARKNDPGQDDFIEGPFCWFLGEPVLFDKPIRYRGQQRLFEVPEAVLKVKGKRV